MANVLRFNKERLAELRRKASESLYFFQKGVWGDKDLDPDFHGPICHFLQRQDQRRKLLCAFRGSLKSSCGRAWLVWMGLENVDWCAKLVEMRHDNAAEHHRMLQDKFLYGPQAALLQDMYSDRLDINRWTTEETWFKVEDPNTHPFLTHAGITSRLEGYHGDAIYVDDPEGADAEVSDAPNEASARFIFNRAEPLLKEPDKGTILVTATPHGPKPVVYLIRRTSEKQLEKKAGNPMAWRCHWKEIIDSSGNPRWPQRFSLMFVEALQEAAQMGRQQRDLWDRQYMLRETSAASGFFDMEKIHQNLYRIEHGRLIVYTKREPVPGLLDDNGFPVMKESSATIDMAYLLYFVHIDPLHVDPENRKGEGNSEWAISVVGVAPDMHAFLVDCWIEDAGFDEAIRQFFRLYRKYRPRKVTVEPVGAQTWIQHYLRIAERTDYRNLMSLPTPWSKEPQRVRRPTLVTEEGPTRNTEKEGWVLEQLEPWVNMGWLHLHSKFEKMIHQFSQVGTGKEAQIDGPDSLAQGPSTWQAPVSEETMREAKKRAEMLKAFQYFDEHTGYRRPWRDEDAA